MKRLLIVQFSGDLRETWRLREASGEETYYGHGYILDQLGEMAKEFDEVGFLGCDAPVHEERLPNGVLSIGAGTHPELKPAPVIAAAARFDPTDLVIFGPIRRLTAWAIARGARTACLFADSFHGNPLITYLRYGWIVPAMNRPQVTLVANHGANAARGLVRLGVRPDKVIAWDFPHVRTPDQFPVKAARGGNDCDLLYVGSIGRTKGVGDLIRAGALLKDRRNVRIRIVGAGKIDRFRRQAAKLGMADRVEFLGIVPNSKVPALMQAADAVIIPSRHAFPEGLPLTLYEALASRTPTVASDHPMFAGHLVDGESAIVYPAANSAALAAAIDRLLGDPELYARISRGAEKAWLHMQNPVKWGDLIRRWTRDEPEDRNWLSGQTIAAIDHRDRR
jgi:glycosyltransferase involved in cell wall biosynthesis